MFSDRYSTMDLRDCYQPSEEEVADKRAQESIVTPCPFCGSECLSINCQGSHGKRCVECDNCGASSGWRGTAEEAVGAWEMRTSPTTKA